MFYSLVTHDFLYRIYIVFLQMYKSNNSSAISRSRLHIFPNDQRICVIETRIDNGSMCSTCTRNYIGSMCNAHAQMLNYISDVLLCNY